MSDKTLTVTQEEPLAIREPSPAAMLDRAIAAGMPADVIEKLTNLYIKIDDRMREQNFGDALMELQRDCEKVKAMRPVMNKEDKGGGVRFTFADFESIMDEVGPRLETHKFAITFDSEFIADGRVRVDCKLTHGGHSAVTRFACRVSDGSRIGQSMSQMDGAAVTFAKRYALCLALNIVVDKIFEGGDARAVGDTIPKEMSADLERRAARFPNKIPFLLALAEVETWEQVPQEAYKRVNKALGRYEASVKEMPQRPATATPASLKQSPGTAPTDSEGNLL